MKLKVLSWNIWIDGDFDQISSFLKAANADIIGLQEVQADDPKRLIIDYLTDLGYNYIFAPVKKAWGGKTWNDGPAVFSKYPIISKQTYILSDGKPRAAAREDIQIGDKIFHVLSTHLVHTHQQPSDEQEEQGKNLLKELPTDSTVVIGDFNAVPESVVIKKMAESLVNVDPSSIPTWGVYPEGCMTCKPQKIDTCLDYIFVTKDIEMNRFKVELSKASDHLPISVMIEV